MDFKGPNAHLFLPFLLSSSTDDLLPPGFPNIDMGPQLKVVERTRTATMLCAASGNPDPEITWYKDFLPIDPSASNGRIKQLRSGKRSSRTSQLCMFFLQEYFCLQEICTFCTRILRCFHFNWPGFHRRSSSLVLTHISLAMSYKLFATHQANDKFCFGE